MARAMGQLSENPKPRQMAVLPVDIFRHMAIYTHIVRDFLAITKALSDPQRLRLLLALHGGELCVCQLVELLGLAGSTVSKHLSLLHRADLVQSRKAERWVHYRLADKKAPVAVREALDWVFKSLCDSTEAIKDQQQLKKILKLNPSTLCKRQCRN